MTGRGYAAIGLHNPKDPNNVGGALRAAGVYGAAMVALGGPRSLKLVSSKTDTMKAWKHMPLLRADDIFDLVPHACVPVAVEFRNTATPLPEYEHPQRAFYVFGPEDGSLGAKAFTRCRDVVWVPTEFCMNLAATVNVILYDRLQKQWEKS